MFVASLEGVTQEELARIYGLGAKRVAAILLTERHRREVSPATAYQDLRVATGYGVRFGVLRN
jgi:hypothetical protein